MPKFSQKFAKPIPKLRKDLCPGFGALSRLTGSELKIRLKREAEIVSPVQSIVKPRLEQRKLIAALGEVQFPFAAPAVGFAGKKARPTDSVLEIRQHCIRRVCSAENKGIKEGD
jgi:hypothetical protein